MIAPSLYLLLVLVLVIGSAFNLPWLVTFSVSVLGLIALAQLWNRFSLKDVIYRRRWHYRRGFPGERFTVRIEIENHKALPVSWLRVSDHWPRLVGPEDTSILAPSHIPDQGYLVSLYSLRWFQRASRAYSLLLRERGVYQVGPYRLESGDLLGMFQSEQEVEEYHYITVFPELLPMRSLDLPTEDPFGDRRTRRRLFEDLNQPMGVRAYHPEDDFRRIHWPNTARTGSLQVKVYQPVSSRVMIACLNVSTMTRSWLGTVPPLLEQLVRTCATIVYQGMQDGYAVGLYSNGCLAHADQPFRIQPGRSSGQLSLLLQALAGVTSFTTGQFEPFLARTIPHIPYGATVVIVTALVTPELVNVLIRLKNHRTSLTLLSLEDAPPPDLPGIRTIHLPFQV